MDPYLLLWQSSCTYANGCVLPDDLERKVEIYCNKNCINKLYVMHPVVYSSQTGYDLRLSTQQ
jgi:hypothetical protein